MTSRILVGSNRKESYAREQAQTQMHMYAYVQTQVHKATCVQKTTLRNDALKHSISETFMPFVLNDSISFFSKLLIP